MMIISLMFAFMAGVTIVVSRSFNAFLANRIGATQSSFFNYFTGLIASLLFLIAISFTAHTAPFSFLDISDYWMLTGGIIGVLNIIILNIIVNKIAPLRLTLFIFIAQLISGMVFDICLYQQFSFQKFIGCVIVIIGLLHYQYVSHKQNNVVSPTHNG